MGVLSKKSKEPLGIEALFHRYYPRLCSFAMRFVHDRGVAEDIVQDVFVVLCERRHVIPEGEKAVKGFLYTSVKHGCLNRLRHLKVVNAFEAKDHLHGNLDVPDVTDAIIHSEIMAAIHEALAALPPGCALVFRKGYLEGLKNHEIAQELNISVNTVKSQKKRAVSLLKEQLDPRIVHVIFPFLMLVQ